MEPTSTREEAQKPPPEPSEPDAVTTAARLVVGAASLGFDALTSRLRSWGRQPPVAEPASNETDEMASVADVVVGMAARGVRGASLLATRGAELAMRRARSAGEASASFGKLVPDFMNEPLDRARERARQRIRRLETLGREELYRSRAIARAALDEGLDALVARLADSRELQFVIRTQSVTAAEQAVDGVRGQAAQIDDRLEGAARKLLRRRPKPPPVAPR